MSCLWGTLWRGSGVRGRQLGDMQVHERAQALPCADSGSKLWTACVAFFLFFLWTASHLQAHTLCAFG